MKTASNSRPFAPCRVSRWTPCRSTPLELNRSSRSAMKSRVVRCPSSNSAREPDDAPEIGLPDHLALAELLRQPLAPAGVSGERPHGHGHRRSLSCLRSCFSSCRAASRASSAAPWNGISASWNGSSKSASRAFVRQSTAICPERDAFRLQRADPLEDERRLRLARGESAPPAPARRGALRAGSSPRRRVRGRCDSPVRAPRATSGSCPRA